VSDRQNGPPIEVGAPKDPHVEVGHHTTADTEKDNRSCRRPALSERGRVVALSGRYARQAPIPAVGQLPDVETTFVGTLLWSPPADAAEVLELVADDDFEAPALSVLVATIRRLAGAGRPCDAQMVLDELGRDGGVHRGIAMQLMDATASGAVPQAARFYAGAVVARSLRRKVESAGNALIEAAQDASEASLAAIVSRAAVSCLDCAGRLAELRGGD
jgi:DnaB-like helicase N terminal domain